MRLRKGSAWLVVTIQALNMGSPVRFLYTRYAHVLLCLASVHPRPQPG